MFNIPSGSTAMIGSMPGISAEQAAGLLTEYPLSLPSWWQLPKRSVKEGMIPQYSEMFPGMVIDEDEKKCYVLRSEELMTQIGEFYEHYLEGNLDAFAISADFAQGLQYFLEDLKKKEKKIPFAKGQITGPVTMGLGLNDQDLRPVWFDEEYRDVVLKGLTMKALWQINELQKYAENVIMFLDEPILSALGTPAYISIQDSDAITALNEIIDAAHEKGAMTGIHCCGNMDWGLLTRTNVDIMAFDAFFYGEKVALYADEVNAFLEQGKYLAWGIVPTAGHEAGVAPAENESAESLEQKLEELLELFTNKGISPELLREQMIFTPSCGMGNLSLDEATTILRLLSSLKT